MAGNPYDQFDQPAANPYDQFDPGAKPDETGDMMRGAKVAFGQTMPILKGVVGLAGATAEKAVGEGGIATGIKNWGLNGFNEGMQKLQPLQRDTDELTTSWDRAKQGDLGALVDWVQYGLGYAAGQAAEAGATAIVGGLIGAAAGGVGAVPGAVAGAVGKGAVKETAMSLVQRAVAKESQRLIAEAAAQGTKLEAKAAVQAATKTVAGNIGSTTALLAYGGAQELGSIYPEAEAEAAKRGAALSGGDLARVWASGIAAGGIEGLTDKLGINVALGKVKLPGAPSRTGSAVRGAVGGVAVEGVTEGVQTGIERVGAGQEVFSPEGVKDIINSAGQGALGGGAAGGALGLIHPNLTPRDAAVQHNADVAMGELAGATTIDEAIDAAQRAVPPLTVPQGFDGDAAMARLDASNDADVKGLKMYGKGYGDVPWSPVPVAKLPKKPGETTADAAMVDSPFSDRLLDLRSLIEQPRVRQQVRDTLGPDALGDLLYYAQKADDASLPGKTSDRMLQVAEALLTRAQVTQLPAPAASPTAAPAPAGPALPAPTQPLAIGLDTTPTGVMRVDSSGSAAPEVRADVVSLRDRARAMAERRNGLTASVSRESEPGVGVMVGDGTLTPGVQRATPAVPETRALPGPAAENASTTPGSGHHLDAAAHDAAPSPQNDRAEPTAAQKEAGNYAKGHVRMSGLDISIENPQGSQRKGVSKAGKAWSTTMQHHYGYIRGTVGMDKDHVDTFIKPGTRLDNAGPVFVVDQMHPETGKPDEHKVMMGFDTLDEARAAYAANYDKKWKGLGNITEASMVEFKQWLASGDTTKPFAMRNGVDSTAESAKNSLPANDLATLRQKWQAAATSGDSELARQINDQIVALKKGSDTPVTPQSDSNQSAPAAAPKREAPIVKYRAEAKDIEAKLPPLAAGMTRLWRGNRPGEEGKNPSFTTSLAGIALPFRDLYKGPLTYVDVQTSDMPQYARNPNGGSTDAEFDLSPDVAARARDVNAPAPLKERVAKVKARAKAAKEEPYTGPTMAEIQAITKEAGTVDVVREAIDAVGEAEFRKQAAARIAESKTNATGQKGFSDSSLIEATALNIVAMKRREKAAAAPAPAPAPAEKTVMEQQRREAIDVATMETRKGLPEIAQPLPGKNVIVVARTLNGVKRVRAQVWEMPGYNGPQLAVAEYKSPRSQGYRVYMVSTGALAADNNGVKEMGREETLKLAINRIQNARETIQARAIKAKQDERLQQAKDAGQALTDAAREKLFGKKPAPAEPQHLEGKTAEPATAPVVAASLKKAARAEDRKPSEMKADLLAQIDTAIAKAPETDPSIGTTTPKTSRGKTEFSGGRDGDGKRIVIEVREGSNDLWHAHDSGWSSYAAARKIPIGGRKPLEIFRAGSAAEARKYVESMLARASLDDDGLIVLGKADMVTFDVPGDGKFTVVNNRDRLADFRAKVEKSPGFSDVGQRTTTLKPATPASAGTKAALENMVEEGDYQAALDYATAKGVSLDDLKLAKAERSKLDSWLKANPQPTEATADEPAPEPPDRQGLRAEDRRLRDLDSAANDLAGQMRFDVTEGDFDAAEVLPGLRSFAEKAGVPADDLRDAVLRELRKSDIAKYQLAKLEEALDPTKEMPPAPEQKPGIAGLEQVARIYADRGMSYDDFLAGMKGAYRTSHEFMGGAQLKVEEMRRALAEAGYTEAGPLKPWFADVAAGTVRETPQSRGDAPMPHVLGIPREAAQAAHAGTSHVPEVRAGQEQESFMNTMRNAWQRAAQVAGTDPAAIARITEEFEKLSSGYRQRYLASLGARSRVMSSMITGPANFPVRRNEKRNEISRKRSDEAQEYLQSGLKRLMRAAHAPIDNSPTSELDRVRTNLAEREAEQEMMKAANAALRKGDDAALSALGLSDEQIAKLKKPDFAGRPGFPDYRLKNNNAEIRRLRERLESANARVETAAAGPTETTVNGVTVREDAQADRLQLIFPDKPSLEMRVKLKKNGFRWAPSTGAWQRQLTGNARYAAEQVIGKPDVTREAISAFNEVSNPDNGANRLPDSITSVKTGAQAIDWLAANMKDVGGRAMAERLRPYIGDGVSVNWLKPGDTLTAEQRDVVRRLNGSAAMVANLRNDGKVDVWARTDKSMDESLLLHELIHAATMRALQGTKNATLRADLSNIVAVVQRSLRDVEYTDAIHVDERKAAAFFARVVDNEDELLAYAFSSPSLRRFMQNMNAQGKFIRDDRRVEVLRDKAESREPLVNEPTLWQKFVDAIRSALGFSKLYAKRFEQALADRDGRIEAYVDAGKDSSLYERLDALLQQAMDANGTETGPVNDKLQAGSEAVMAAIRGFDQKAARNLWSDLTTDYKSAGPFNAFNTQYAKAQKNPTTFGRVFDAVQDYIKDISTFANAAADLAPNILPKLETWRDVVKGGLTRHGADPADLKATGAALWKGTLEDQRVYDDGELAALGLNATQRGLYHEARAAIDQSLDDLGRTEVVRLAGPAGAQVAAQASMQSTMADAAAVLTAHLRQVGDVSTAALLDEKVAQVQKLKADGYAPLMRFGRHTLHITRDGETQFFGMYESNGEANEAARKMAADPDFAGAQFKRGLMSEKAFELFQGMNLDALELFAKVTGAEDNAAYQDFLKLTKNNRSAMKRMIHREGIAGFSEDTSRVLAAFVTSNARAASGNMHMGRATQAAEAIPKEMGDLKDDAIALVKYVQNPTEEAAAVRGLLFTNFIGGSVASAAVNLTQSWTMLAPYLTQYGGFLKAAGHVAAAWKAAGTGQMSDQVASALRRAERDGIVSPQEIHHLQAEAMGKARNPFVKKALFVWGSLFSLSEQFNRRVSFIAAYNTALEHGMDNPFKFAERAVIETQGLYNKGNKPNVARGAIGATVMTFKQFGIHYLEFLTRMWHSGPEGKKAVGTALAILMLTAGAGGLPFADDLDDLIDTAMQGLGYNFSSKKAKRKFIAETLGLGDGAADFFTRGVSGIAGMPIDVSVRMGMGNLLPGTGALLRSNTDRSRDVLEFAGAAGGLAKSAMDAGSAALKGDLAKAGMGMAPLAVQNIAKAAEMWNTGEYRNQKGQKVINTSPVDAAMKFIGFQPAEVARQSAAQGEVLRSIQLAKNVESEIAAKWAQGLADNRPELVSEARQELAEWNSKNAETPMRLTMQQIIGRVREMRMSRAERTIKSAPREMRQAVREGLAQ